MSGLIQAWLMDPQAFDLVATAEGKPCTTYLAGLGLIQQPDNTVTPLAVAAQFTVTANRFSFVSPAPLMISLPKFTVARIFFVS
jgi:hypothetical protein